MHTYLLLRHVKVADGGGEVEHCAPAERPQRHRHDFQQGEVLRHRLKGERHHQVALQAMLVAEEFVLDAVVALVHGKQHPLLLVLQPRQELQVDLVADLATKAPRERHVRPHAVTVHHLVPQRQETFHARRPALALAEVVDETHRVPLQRHRRPPARHTHHRALKVRDQLTHRRRHTVDGGHFSEDFALCSRSKNPI